MRKCTSTLKKITTDAQIAMVEPFCKAESFMAQDVNNQTMF